MVSKIGSNILNVATIANVIAAAVAVRLKITEHRRARLFIRII